MMLETGIEVAEDCTVFDYGLPHKGVKSKDIAIVTGQGIIPPK